MTYRELLEALTKLSEEQLDSDVTIHLASEEEFFSEDIGFLIADEEVQVLDEGHPYFQFYS